jgi:hypothetical protein
MKKVPAVPSGPTKLNGPLGLFEPASWNCRAVFAGVVAFQENVDQIDVRPPAGLLSFG